MQETLEDRKLSPKQSVGKRIKGSKLVDVLTLADGTEIDTSTGRPYTPNGSTEVEPTYVQVPNYADTQRQIVAARTRIADFPVPPKAMTSVGIVLFYSMLGISDEEMSSITGLTEDQIGRIRVSDTYSTIYQDFLDKIIDHDMDDVRTMFVKGSKAAAGRMMSLMNSESEGIQIAAAKDILDRSGQRPADVVEHRHKIDGGLVIEVVRKDNKEDIPTIEHEVL
jgi:hypothetical protein